MTGRDRYREGQWYDVPTRNDRRQRNPDGVRSGVQITKMFVSNIPPRCSSDDLVQVLKGFGDIQGTYIARKYDKLGKRFGFVSFGNVKDPEVLETNLKDVWIGSYKLFIGIARFVDGVKVQDKTEKNWKPVQHQAKEKNVCVDPDPKIVYDKPGTSNVGGRSFRDTLLDIQTASDTVEIAVPDEVSCCKNWYDLGLLGRVVDFKSITILRNWFSSSINKKVTFKYLGGFNVMVVFDSIEDKVWFLEKKNLWESVFQTLEEWEGQIFEFERIAWIKIYGIPLCLMIDSVIMDIGKSIGEVVQLSDLNDGNDLSYVLMGVLCKSVNRIHQKVQLAWRSKVFPVVIEEDPGDWVPDCIIEIDEDSSVEKNDIEDEIMFEEDNSHVIGSQVGGEINLEGAEKEDQGQQSIISPNDEGNHDANNCGVSVIDHSNTPERQVEPLIDFSGGISKKAKGYRKKSRKKLSVSPVGQDRPKKRPRGDEDLFDIDRLIQNVNGTPAQHHVNSDQAQDVFCTPDLNKEINNEDAVVGTEKEDGNVASVSFGNDEVQREVEETMTLGGKLGANNIELFETAVNKLVREEGFQGVQQ